MREESSPVNVERTRSVTRTEAVDVSPSLKKTLLVFSACTSQRDCDPNALCLNTFDSYSCQCRPGFYDDSPDPETRPGRKCKECESSTFSQTVIQ